MKIYLLKGTGKSTFLSQFKTGHNITLNWDSSKNYHTSILSGIYTVNKSVVVLDPLLFYGQPSDIQTLINNICDAIEEQDNSLYASVYDDKFIELFMRNNVEYDIEIVCCFIENGKIISEWTKTQFLKTWVARSNK